MRCPLCGLENIAGADECAACGQSLEICPPESRTPVEEGLQAMAVAALEPVPPVCLDPTTPVFEAIQLMAERNIGSVLITQAGALLGIFSERDALLKVAARLAELDQRPVREFMTPAPDTLTPEDPIVFALNRMVVGDYRHLPICHGKRTVGIISARDVLRYVTCHFPELEMSEG